MLRELGGVIASAIRSENEPLTEVHAAIYRSMIFALQVVEDIKSSPIGGLQLSDVLSGEDNESIVQSIHDQTSEYLSTRANIDALIGSFATEIDPSYKYEHHVETAAALMFMLCEREQGAKALRQRSQQSDPSDFC